MKVGLALGGGVVRGMAHVGALATLVNARIPIDVVSGTSVGSMVGALFCAGLDVAEIEYIASKIGWRDIARPVLSSKGLVTFQPMEEILERLLGKLEFRDLEIPFAAVACDLECGDEVVLTEGALAAAVRASSSVPGFVTPRRLNGRVLGDGGIVNNLPVSAARALGAQYVIAIDIFEPSYVRGWGPLGMGMTALELLISSAGGGVDQADCLIQPGLAGVSYLLFSEQEELVRLGREAAEAALPQIRQALEHN